MKAYNYKYIFGPVASRRLGYSLGIDITPFKTCTYDCVYCQLGKTTHLTAKRKEYVKYKDLMSEFTRKLNEGINADYLTFSGSGEPTLNSAIGRMIRGIKKLSSIPVAVITNGSLLYKQSVRDDLMDADLVIPSLDAGSLSTFKKINRPSKGIKFERMIEGLISFSREFKGDLALEIMFSEGINTFKDELKKLKQLIGEIKADRVELNTVVRPPAKENVQRVKREKLEAIKMFLDPKAVVIGRIAQKNAAKVSKATKENILAILKRHPATIDDIARGLHANASLVAKYVGYLKGQNQVDFVYGERKIYYRLKNIRGVK